MSDDIVTQVAKMISPEAFTQWYDGTGPEAKPVHVARQKYQMAEARNTAYAVLKLAASTPKLRSLLAECEKDDWEKLGVPVRNHRELEEIVEQKYEVTGASRLRGAQT